MKANSPAGHEGQQIAGQTTHEPLRVSAEFLESPIGRIEPAFHLYKEHFFKLRQLDPIATSVGAALVSTGVGILINESARALADGLSAIPKSSLIAMALAFGIGLIFLFVGIHWSKDRREVLSEISDYFAANKPTRPIKYK